MDSRTNASAPKNVTMAVFHTKRAFRTGLSLLIFALLTLAFGITLIVLHSWSELGACAVFNGLLLVFTGALGILISKKRSKPRLYFLFSIALISLIAVLIMLCLSALAIRKDCDQYLNAPNSTPNQVRYTMSCILAIDVVVFVIGLVDLVPISILAHISWSTIQVFHWNSNGPGPQVVIIPVYPTTENGNPTLSASEQEELRKILENGNINDEQNNDCNARFGQPFYVTSAPKNGMCLPLKVTHIASMSKIEEAKYSYIVEEEEKRLIADKKQQKAEELKLAKQEKERVNKEEKERKELEKKLAKEEKEKQKAEKKKEKKKKSENKLNVETDEAKLSKEEQEAVNSIVLATSDHSGLGQTEITEAFVENAPLDDLADDLPHLHEGSVRGHLEFLDEPRDLYTTDQETTRYNSLTSPGEYAKVVNADIKDGDLPLTAIAANELSNPDVVASTVEQKPITVAPLADTIAVTLPVEETQPVDVGNAESREMPPKERNDIDAVVETPKAPGLPAQPTESSQPSTANVNDGLNEPTQNHTSDIIQSAICIPVEESVPLDDGLVESHKGPPAATADNIAATENPNGVNAAPHETNNTSKDDEDSKVNVGNHVEASLNSNATASDPSKETVRPKSPNLAKSVELDDKSSLKSVSFDDKPTIIEDKKELLPKVEPVPNGIDNPALEA